MSLLFFIAVFHKSEHVCVKVLHEVVETICLMKPNISDAQSLFQHKLHVGTQQSQLNMFI